MALKITKEHGGIVMTPKKEEVYPGGGVLYPRVIELHHAGELNGMLLATFDHSTLKEPPVSPIYCSKDHGKTWEHYSDMADTHNGYGIRFQPVFFELPQQCGDLPAGTIVFAGNSVPLSFKVTELLFYISRDHGKTWEYRSTIVAGGPPIEQNWDELGPVWEPFIYINAYGEITVAYTDERPHTNRLLNQCLAVIASKDGGLTWGEPQLTVAVPDGVMRPGMAIVTKLPNGKYFMVYEMVGLPDCDLHFKISDDGMDFGDPASRGVHIETAEGFFEGSMPYVEWTPYGGPNGTIIVSGKRDCFGDMSKPYNGLRYRNPGDFLVNYNLGEGPWERVPMLVSYDSRVHQAGWSMGMALIENGTKLIQMCPSTINTDEEYILTSIENNDPILLEITYGIGTLATEE